MQLVYEIILLNKILRNFVPFRKYAMKLCFIHCYPYLSLALSRNFVWHILWLSTTDHEGKNIVKLLVINILGDPGADSGDERKSKRAEKCGAKKSKEQREKPLGTMSYQTSSKLPPQACLGTPTCVAVVSLFWNTTMAAVTSCENPLFLPRIK